MTQPFVILIVMARLARFDQSSVEAARDLGATRWQAFRLVTLPQIPTAIVGAALMAAAISLDDFIIASFTIGGGNTHLDLRLGQDAHHARPFDQRHRHDPAGADGRHHALALRLTRYRG